MARQPHQNGELTEWRLAHLPVVGHDEHAEEELDDGERHDQRVEAVAQLLPLEGNKEDWKGRNLHEKKILSLLDYVLVCR